MSPFTRMLFTAMLPYRNQVTVNEPQQLTQRNKTNMENIQMAKKITQCRSSKSVRLTEYF